MEELKQAAAYIRVSTDKQEELSPDAQKRLILEYAKKNNMIINKEHIFIENGISGRNAEKRPKFQAMIALAKQKPKPFDVILVWKFSRFTRNQEESIVYKSILKKQNNIEVVSISEPLIEGPFGSLIERIIEWMDEYYSIRLSGEVIRGMTENALRGAYQCAAPFGYDRRKGDIPIVNEKEAEFVRLIFRRYADGYDLSSIARTLNEMGVKTKRNGFFEYRTIRYILENPFYIGMVRWNRAKHSSHRPNDESEIITVAGKHEPIIEKFEWNVVQNRIKATTKPYQKRSSTYANHWLCGMLKCPICNSTLAYTSAKNARQCRHYPGFQCYKYAKGIHSESQSIVASKAEQIVLTELENVIHTGMITFEYIPQKETDDSILERLEKELNRIEQKEGRIKTAYMDGVDNLQEYKSNKEIIEKQRSEIMDSIKNEKSRTIVNQEKPPEELMLRRIQTVINVLKSTTVTTEEKANAIRSIMKKIVLHKGAEANEFFYYYS